MKFKLEIVLGNDAMRTCADVREALRNVIERMAYNDYSMKQEIDRGIMDANGNTVGSFHLVKE